MAMIDTTASLAERVARTNEILADLKALWSDGSVRLTIHRLPHDRIHESEAAADHFLACPGHNEFLSTRPHGIQLFGINDPDCAACRSLPTVRAGDAP